MYRPDNGDTMLHAAMVYAWFEVMTRSRTHKLLISNANCSTDICNPTREAIRGMTVTETLDVSSCEDYNGWMPL